MKRILLAGATGYLGRYLAKEIKKRSIFCRAIVRDPIKLAEAGVVVDDVLKAELTDPASIVGSCKKIDTVISTVGITRQKDGLGYMDVDYQANMNLLKEAIKSKVKKFIYVSVLNGDRLKHLKICEAKERFVENLQQSGLDYCVIRPNGFFSDMAEFYTMAKKGRIYLLGDGQFRVNPIHGKDLAVACVNAVEGSEKEIKIGGPETLSHNEIALTAFAVTGVAPKISRIPDWVRHAILKTIRLVTGSKTYGPIEFFLTVMAMDMRAPEYGHHTLKDYFLTLKQADD